ncbi:MAG: hypothetical protein ACLFQK_06075 [Fibrobacterota bacterium]
MKNILLIAAILTTAVFILRPSRSAGFRPAGIIPGAHASGIVEWNSADQMVSTSKDGSAAFVWDFSRKTQVRKYYIEGEKLKMKTYNLED